MSNARKPLVTKERPRSSPLAVGLSFVGAVVGAGFISGQELVQFFVRFGCWGIVGWLLTVVVIIFGGGYLLWYVALTKPESFDKVVRQNFSGIFAKFVNLVVNGYLVGGLLIMLSGSGGLLSQLLGLPMFLGVTIVSLAIFLTIIGKGERILTVNKFLVPFLVLSTVFVTIKLLFADAFKMDLDREFTIKNPSPILINWFLSVLFYLGYNIIGAIVAVVNIGREITSKKGKIGGRLGGVIVAFLGSLIILTLWITYPEWQQSDLPIVTVLKQRFEWLYPVFVPSMIIAMFTVATAYALGLSKYLKERCQFNFVYICAGVLLIAIPMSLLGFSRLLGMIYPFFGIMATFIFAYYFDSQNTVQLAGRINATKKQTLLDSFQNTASACCAVVYFCLLFRK